MSSASSVYDRDLCVDPDNATFRPTMDKFGDMARYIVEDLGTNTSAPYYGISLIIPPQEAYHPKGLPLDFAKGGEDALGSFGTTPVVREYGYQIPRLVADGAPGVYEVPIDMKAQKPPLTINEFIYEARRKRMAEPFSYNINQACELFWDALEQGADIMSVPPMYAVDVETSLFTPDRESKLWNLAKIPEDFLCQVLAEGFEGDMESLVMAGIHTPYMYVGTAMSMFGMHVEDCNLQSVNYHHGGHAKIWYSVVQDDIWKFEKLARNFLRSEYESGSQHALCADPLRHKMWMFSPKWFSRHGIRYVRLIQQPGQYILTWPRGYHQGFNLGMTMNEARNILYPEFVKWTMQATSCNCWKRDPRTLLQDESPMRKPVLFSRIPYALRALQAEEVLEYVKGKMTYPERREDGAAPALMPRPSKGDMTCVKDLPTYLQDLLNDAPMSPPHSQEAEQSPLPPPLPTSITFEHVAREVGEQVRVPLEQRREKERDRVRRAEEEDTDVVFVAGPNPPAHEKSREESPDASASEVDPLALAGENSQREKENS